jgi:hypothetical protein
MVEVIKLVDIPGQYEGRRKRFDRSEVIVDALAVLSGTSPGEAVRFQTQDHFKALNIHNIIKKNAEKSGMEVGVRVTDEWTYIWLKNQKLPF